MSINSEVREKIFNIYSENIRLCFNALGKKLLIDGVTCNEKFYICPICYNVFLKDGLDTNLPIHLTLEDIPPQSLGGNPKLLTCKPCNNASGKKLDSQLKWHIEELSNKSDKPITKRVKLKVEGFHSTGNFVLGTDGNNELFIDSYLNSELTKNFEKIMNKWKGTTITANFQLPNPNTVQLALIRIAYLMMCSKFGFGYSYSASAQSVRDIIHKINVSAIKPFLFNLNGEHFNLNPGIYFISSPNELKSYLAKIVLKLNGFEHEFYIPIPGPNLNYLEYIELLRQKKSIKFEISSLPEIDYLTDLENLFLYENNF